MPSKLNVGLRCACEDPNEEINKPPKSQIAANVQVLEKIKQLTGSGLSRMPFTSSDCRIKYIGIRP